ncbi:MAG: rhomboid family intramembrane serine protease [Phycisphaerae bacterium]|nr:rhomboid family intramembrane serine protease [Phycisphaerae bacterium]MDD5381787.1 rhomboid family intramembrane serine protease [Phycisphaerae bacterium]
MFVPYAVDAPFDRQPVANWLVVGVIFLVFVLQVATSEKQASEKSQKGIDRPVEDVLRVRTDAEEAAAKQAEKEEKPVFTGPMARFVLDGWGTGLFTYSWLHGVGIKGFVRVIGNLIFLWAFGNAVCSKLGNKLYPSIYLGLGLLAGVIHLAIGSGQALGAGAVICGIVGMYIVLFPEDSMSCFVLLPRPMAVSVSGCWMVLLWFVFDILEALSSGQSITYYAHILCVGAGGGLAILMLKKNWLVMESDEKSILQMFSKKENEEELDKEGEKKGEKQESKDSQTVEKQLTTADGAKAELNPISSASHFPAGGDSRVGQPAPAAALQQKTAPVVEKPQDDFIRFKCECGHRIKLHKKDAGKAGRCPKCSRWLEAPRQ